MWKCRVSVDIEVPVEQMKAMLEGGAPPVVDGRADRASIHATEMAS